MKLLPIFNPELNVTVKFRVMSSVEVDSFLARFGSASKEEFARALLEQTIFNLNSEVATSLRKQPKSRGKDILDSLVNGCLMLNPTVDVDSWHKISTGLSLFDVIDNGAMDKKIPATRRKRGSTQPARRTATSPRRITKAKYDGLKPFLKASIIGQDAAIDEVNLILKRSLAGLHDEKRPVGVFLLAGFSGTGKTFFAKKLHEHLYGNENLVRIDCGEYQHKHENAKLTGCFVPGTNILLEDGTTKPIEQVLVGDRVITHKGRSREVLKTHIYETDQDVIQLSFSNSDIPILATPSHEILAIRMHKDPKKRIQKFNRFYKSDKLSWVPISELEKDDIVVYPRVRKAPQDLPIIIDLWDYCKDLRNYKYDANYVWAYEDHKVNRFITVNQDFVRLAGYYVADGGNSKSRKNHNYTLHNDQKSYALEEIPQLIKRLFGGDVTVSLEKKTENTSRLFIHSRVLAIFMAELFGDHTLRKHFPEWIYRLSEDLQYHFLDAAILCDGSRTVLRRIDYSTSSKQLYYQMNMLLRSLGWITYLLSDQHNGYPNWNTRYRIYISGAQINSFSGKLPVIGPGVKLSNFKTSIQRKSFADENYIFLRVTDKQTVEYEGPVYDLSVEEDVSYVANELAVHNSPAGYIGYEDGGILTNALIENPNTVVLFDEIEKAHPDIVHTLLSAFDEGVMTDAQGNKASFRNAIIILTTNLGSRELANGINGRALGFGEVDTNAELSRPRVVRVTTEAVKKRFPPEFLNRIDKVIVFNHLTKDDFAKISELEFDAIAAKAGKRGYFIAFDELAVEAMVRDGFSPVQGARGLAQLRRDRIENPLADLILSGRYPRGTTFKVTFDAEDFRVRARRPAAPKRRPTKACSSN